MSSSTWSVRTPSASPSKFRIIRWRSAGTAAARRASVVPVRRELLADQVTPVAVFGRLCAGQESGFLLESVDHGGRWSRWSFAGRSPRARIVSKGGVITTAGDLPSDLDVSGGMLATVQQLLDAYRAEPDESLPPLHSGVVGFLGYDVVREVEHLPDVPTDDRGWPDAVVSVIGDLVALDHWSQRAILISNVFVPAGATDDELLALYDEARVRLDELAAAGATPIDEPMVSPPDRSDDLPDVTSSMGAGQYEAAVEVAKEHIRAGDIFQVVLAQRFDFDLDADPFDVYRVLRQINPSPYMYFIREPELCLVGCSPEPMVQLLGGRVISRPIAGTRFRGTTDEHDRKLAAELLEHPKERAEHIMLVDLARNDVGRVAEYGSVRVSDLMVIERYSHVMHIVSNVDGRLRPDKSAYDVMRATFPAGTVSGSPKVRAMEIINECEKSKRCAYAGAVGYFGFDGNLDSCIALRTCVVKDGKAYVQAGAGVVADSDPAYEYRETVNKATGMLRAIEWAKQLGES